MELVNQLSKYKKLIIIIIVVIFLFIVINKITIDQEFKDISPFVFY